MEEWGKTKMLEPKRKIAWKWKPFKNVSFYSTFEYRRKGVGHLHDRIVIWLFFGGGGGGSKLKGNLCNNVYWWTSYYKYGCRRRPPCKVRGKGANIPNVRITFLLGQKIFNSKKTNLTKASHTGLHCFQKLKKTFPISKNYYTSKTRPSGRTIIC